MAPPHPDRVNGSKRYLCHVCNVTVNRTYYFAYHADGKCGQLERAAAGQGAQQQGASTSGRSTSAPLGLPLLPPQHLSPQQLARMAGELAAALHPGGPVGAAHADLPAAPFGAGPGPCGHNHLPGDGCTATARTFRPGPGQTCVFLSQGESDAAVLLSPSALSPRMQKSTRICTGRNMLCFAELVQITCSIACTGPGLASTWVVQCTDWLCIRCTLFTCARTPHRHMRRAYA